MPVKACQRDLKDTINNKTYQLTVQPHLGGWLVNVIVVGEDTRWPEQIDNATVETAKEWAIKKALIEAFGPKYEEVYPLAAALSESWTDINLPSE